MTIVCGTLGVLLLPTFEVDHSFYSTEAQVLIVILLGLAVEHHVFAHKEAPLAVLAVYILVIFTEMVALYATARPPHDGHVVVAVTGAGTLGGLIGAVVIAMRKRPAAPD